MGTDAIVAGTGFEGRAAVVRAHVREGMPVQLRREKSNPYDPNAIVVLVSVPRLFGLLGSSTLPIGYIKARAAKGIAAKIDAGVEVSCHVKSFYAPPGREFPRVSLRLEWPET